MDDKLQKRPRVRQERKNFIVEQNIDAIQWPPECAVCGGRAEVTDTLKLEATFKNLGKVRIEVPGIPYCQGCFPKIRRGKLLDRVRYIVALVLGIPIGLLFVWMATKQPGATFVWCGLLLAMGLLIGYGLAWLIVKFPVKMLFRGYFVEPVDAWLVGTSVVISIPNRGYAAKFAQLNMV